MKKLFIRRRYFAALIVCIVFTLIAGSHSSGQESKCKTCPCVPNPSPGDYCLLSNCNMRVLTAGNFGNPANAEWGQINAIPCADADGSDWGKRCPYLPWKFLYEHGACWVYGNQGWQTPNKNVEYYKLDFNLEECSTLSFEAFIDDCAAFYIDGTGPGSNIYDSCEAQFQCAKHTFTSYCLAPGPHTLYIKHRDTHKVIYGLIFAAKCMPCDCCCNELCGCFKKESCGYVFYKDCNPRNEPIVLDPGENIPGIDEEFLSLKDYFFRYPDREEWCARICIINEDGKVSLQWWEALPDRTPPECCPGPECCDYELITPKIPRHLGPGESCELAYTIRNNCPRGDDIAFNYLYPADGSVAFVPQGLFTVPGGETQEITVTYTMPGVPGGACIYRSHTFKWALVIVGRDCPSNKQEHRIHCSKKGKKKKGQ